MARPTRLVFALAALCAVSPLGAQARKTGRGTVVRVDFNPDPALKRLILGDVEGCGARWSNKLTFRSGGTIVWFDDKTAFEYGRGNPADASILAAARTIEFVCPANGLAPTPRITVLDPFQPAAPLDNGLGRFPLLDVAESLAYLGTFTDIAGDPDVENGVNIQRLNPDFAFDTGDCRILFDSATSRSNGGTHFQCDFAASQTSVARLSALVNSSLGALYLRAPAAPGGPIRAYVRFDGAVRVEIWSAPFLRLVVNLNY